MRWPFEKLPTFTKACTCNRKEWLKKKYPDASPHEIDEAMKDAWACFASFRKQPGKERGRLLRTIARHLEKRSWSTRQKLADSETSLGHDRLGFELKRTITELELFAGLAESGKWKEQKEKPSEPNRKPIPKPGMQTENVPIGPVLVIGAAISLCHFSRRNGHGFRIGSRMSGRGQSAS